MGKMGGFTAADLKKLQKQLNKIQQSNVEAFIDACAKELAARLLAKVIKRTRKRQRKRQCESIRRFPENKPLWKYRCD